MGNTLLLNKLTEQANAACQDVLKTIAAITDEASFVECDKFITSATPLGEAFGDGVVTGFAQVNDVQVGIFAINPTVLKGSIGCKNAAKITKLIDNSVKMGAPVIGIIDTAGARLGEGIEAMEGYSSIIKAFSNAYGSVPTVCVIKGNNFGLSAYLTAVCDICIAYEKAVIATSSPLILAANTKLDVAKVGTVKVHTAETGIIGSVVKNDAELKKSLSDYIGFFAQSIISPTDDGNRESKLKAGAKLTEVIAEAFDKKSFYEVRKDFTENVITGYARLDGIAVGVIAVSGKLTANGAIKICDMLNTCESFGVTVCNVVDCEGAESNLAAENGGLIREVANMLYTYNVLSVAKVSLITGACIGLGYSAFASKAIFDYSIAWDNASINLLSDVAAANLLYGAEINAAKDKKKAEEKLADSYKAENSSALVVCRQGYLDNVISPVATRQYLIAAVQMFLAKRG